MKVLLESRGRINSKEGIKTLVKIIWFYPTNLRELSMIVKICNFAKHALFVKAPFTKARTPII